jgi:formate hydrogenlyase subunit 6/NADH:ubiquinone oxidoreductase subunit I
VTRTGWTLSVRATASAAMVLYPLITLRIVKLSECAWCDLCRQFAAVCTAACLVLNPIAALSGRSPPSAAAQHVAASKCMFCSAG